MRVDPVALGALRPLSPWPWLIRGRDGSTIFCETKADWLAEWRHRIRIMEADDRPIQARRAGLERALACNAGAFPVIAHHGAADAVLELLEMFCAADARLATRQL